DEARKQAEALAAAETKLKSALGSLEARLGCLEASEGQRALLEKILMRTAAEMARRETQHAALHETLESLRHDWRALPVRQELKKLVGPFAGSRPDLVHLSAVTPSVWNHSQAGFRFGVSIFPDLERPGG